MAKHFNKLTPEEAERLAILAEECGEVIQIVGKILRHGYESHSPIDDQGSNRLMLERELGDIAFIVSLLVNQGDVDVHRIEQACKQKCGRIEQYLHHTEGIDV